MRRISGRASSFARPANERGRVRVRREAGIRRSVRRMSGRETGLRLCRRRLRRRRAKGGEDMKIEAGHDYILFDGDCGVCTWSAEVVRRMDRGRGFIVEPYQAFDESELARFGINYEKCSRAAQVITRKGRVYAGAFGVNYFLWRRFPWSVAVFLVYAIPVLLLLEVIGYRIVAENRHRISRWFGMQACLIKESDC